MRGGMTLIFLHKSLLITRPLSVEADDATARRSGGVSYFLCLSFRLPLGVTLSQYQTRIQRTSKANDVTHSLDSNKCLNLNTYLLLFRYTIIAKDAPSSHCSQQGRLSARSHCHPLPCSRAKCRTGVRRHSSPRCRPLPQLSGRNFRCDDAPP